MSINNNFGFFRVHLKKEELLFCFCGVAYEGRANESMRKSGEKQQRKATKKFARPKMFSYLNTAPHHTQVINWLMTSTIKLTV